MEPLWTAAKWLLGLLALVGAFAVYAWLREDEVQEHRVTFLQGIEADDKLFTGFAYVSLISVQFSGDSAKADLTEDWHIASDKVLSSKIKRNDIAGVCAWFYRISFGFENRQKALDTFLRLGSPQSDKLSIPTILTVEALDVFAKGDGVLRRKCDDQDRAVESPSVSPEAGLANSPKDRRQRILERLAYDGLLTNQYYSACRSLSLLASPVFAPRSEASSASRPPRVAASAPFAQAATAPTYQQCVKQANQQISLFVRRVASTGRKTTMASNVLPAGSLTAVGYGDALVDKFKVALGFDSARIRAVGGETLDDPVGAIGALAVSLSTVGYVSYSKKLFWIIPVGEEFQVRRELATVYYGSSIRSIVAREQGGVNVWVARADEPSRLAVDRKTQVTLSSPNFYKSVKADLGQSNRDAVSALELALSELEPRLARMAKTNVRAALTTSANKAGVKRLEIAFE